MFIQDDFPKKFGEVNTWAALRFHLKLKTVTVLFYQREKGEFHMYYIIYIYMYIISFIVIFHYFKDYLFLCQDHTVLMTAAL